MNDFPPLSRVASTIRRSVFADLAPHIQAFTERGGELIALHIGDTYRAPPDAARFLHAAQEPGAYDGALYRYGPIDGLATLRESLATYLLARERGPRAIDPSRHVLLGCGATHAIFCAARAILNPGDDVLLASPYWPLSIGILHACGANPIEVPLTQRLFGDPSCDAGAVFEASVTPKTRAIYIISPNNPDGKVLSKEHLRQIAKFAERHNLWVIADEVYADYAYAAPHASIAALPGMAERTITAFSFSKSHALAGARVGVVIAPERVVAAGLRLSTHTVFNVPLIAQRLAAAALATGDAWVDESRTSYLGVRDAVAAALVGAPVRFRMPEGGSYLFIDFAPVLEVARRPLRDLLAECIASGVLLAPGEAFGAGFESWARLCFTAAPPATVLEGVARLREALERFIQAC